jgi:hypothetical protein
VGTDFIRPSAPSLPSEVPPNPKRDRSARSPSRALP